MVEIRQQFHIRIQFLKNSKGNLTTSGSSDLRDFSFLHPVTLF